MYIKSSCKVESASRVFIEQVRSKCEDEVKSAARILDEHKMFRKVVHSDMSFI